MGAGEIAQWLRTLATPGNPSVSPSTHIRGSQSPVAIPLRDLVFDGARTHTHTHTHTHTAHNHIDIIQVYVNKNKSFKKEFN